MDDLSAYKTLYIATAKENMEKIKNGLAVLAKDQTDNVATEEVFRHAHTLKTKSLMMGYQDISDLAKSIEDALFGVINKNNVLTLELLNRLINISAQIKKSL